MAPSLRLIRPAPPPQVFTSPEQRRQLLDCAEVLTPSPGDVLQRIGELSVGLLVVEAGTVRRISIGAPGALPDSPGPAEVLPAGSVVGSLGTSPAAFTLLAGGGGTRCLLIARRPASIILAPTHELRRRKLAPRTSASHMQPVLPPPPPPFDELRVSGLLGEGSSSRVLLVRKGAIGGDGAQGGGELALKCARDAAGYGAEATWVRREQSALLACQHPFIPRLIGASPCFLLMEAARGCELFYLLREVRRFEPSTAALYAAMTLSALVHLHGKRIVHRDLKPENIVLDSDGYVRLVDLGLARQLSHPAERAWTLCGTPEYTAPELIRGEGHALELDLWAVGVLVFELISGYPPFCADDPVKVYAAVLQGSPALPSYFTPAARSLVQQLLQPQPHARLGALGRGAVQVACHPFFDGVDWMALLGRKVDAPLIPIVAELRSDDPSVLATLEAELLQGQRRQQQHHQRQRATSILAAGADGEPQRTRSPRPRSPATPHPATGAKPKGAGTADPRTPVRPPGHTREARSWSG